MTFTADRSLGSLLEKMVSPDTDYRFMAINDLINELKTDSFGLDRNSERDVVIHVLRLLQDPNGEVQSLAVKSLGPLTLKVSLPQVKIIMCELISTVLKGDEQLRSIGAIGLKTVTNVLPASSDSAVSQMAIKELVPTLLSTMVSETSDINVRTEACDVLSEMINHFGALLAPYHSELIDCVLAEVNSSHTPLRKRALHALSGLAWSISQAELKTVIVYLLLCLNGSNSSTTDASLADQRAVIAKERPRLTARLKHFGTTESTLAVICGLNAVARHLFRVPHLIEHVLQQLIFLLQQHRRADESTSDDLMELVIQTLDTLIHRCPGFLKPWIPELTTLLCQSLQYGTACYDGSGREVDSMSVDDGDGTMNDSDVDDHDDGDEDDDGEYYSDDEDTSWKVRRAAARALETVITSYPESTADFYVKIASLLVKRFNEREEPVRLSIFACIAALLRQTQRVSSNLFTRQQFIDSIPKTPVTAEPSDGVFVDFELSTQLKDPNSAQSHLLSVLPSLFAAINRQVSCANQKKVTLSAVYGRSAPSVQHAALMLHRDLALALPGQLTAHLDTLLTSLHAICKDPSVGNTVKVDMVNLVVLLVQSHPASCFHGTLSLLVEVACWAIGDPFYRVVLEGLELSQLLAARLRGLGAEQFAVTLFKPIFLRLQAEDKDLELREKTTICVATFIGNVGDLLNHDLAPSLDKLQQRLHNEMARLAGVRAIHIVVSSTLPLDLSNLLPTASDVLSTFLSKNDRILRLATLRCLYTIWLRYPQLVGPNCLAKILELVPQLLIGEQDLQTSQLALHLLALLIESAKNGSTPGSNDLAQGMSVQLLSSNVFVEPLVSLAHSPLLRSQALEAMLRLMRAIGRYDPNSHTLTTLFLTRLLAPMHGSGLLHLPAGGASNSLVHRDALSSLAQCVTELLLQLPTRATSGGSSNSACSPSSVVDSLNTAIDRLIAAVKDSAAPPMQVYLNLLILGELGRKLDLSNRADIRQVLLSCLSISGSAAAPGTSPQLSSVVGSITEGVRPAAALSLGRLTIGQPSYFLPLLISEIAELVRAASQPVGTGSPSPHQQQLYHLLQALKEALLILAGNQKGNDVLNKQLDTIWSLLMSSAGLPEEGTRNIVSECFGRLVLVSPRVLLPRLCDQVNSNQVALVRSTLITAIKFIMVVTDVDVSYPLGVSSHGLPADSSNSSRNYAEVTDQQPVSHGPCATTLNELDVCLRSDSPSPLLACFRHLSDTELIVHRAVLITLNTTAHHRPSLLRPLLNVPLPQANGENRQPVTLLSLLYQETIVRPDLIHVVVMGPFKHQEDDGLELRKCAFECMSTLLDTCTSKLDIARFMDPLIEGLKDHADIKLLSQQMLQRVALLRPQEIGHKMEAIANALRAVLLTKANQDWVKQEMEKMQEVTRSAMAVVASLKQIDEMYKNQHFMDLMSTVKADPNLRSLYQEAISSSANAGTSSVNPTAPSAQR